MRLGRAWRGSVVGLGMLAAAVSWSRASSQPAPAATPPIPVAPQPGAAPQDLKLIQDRTARLRLSVMVNGKGPYDFLVDTGADRTVISRQLAVELMLPQGNPVNMHVNAGMDFVQTAVIDHLVIGGRLVEGVQAPVVDQINLGAAGMLGVDALKNLHIVMDFKAMRLTSSPSREEPLAPGTVVVRGKSRFGQLILADASVRGVPVFVVVDTGAQISIGNPALLRLLYGRRPPPAPTANVELVGVTGRSSHADLELVQDANVGGLEIHNMRLAFAQDHIFNQLQLINEPALLLGMDVLGQCQRISVDMRRRTATFTLN